MGTHYISRTISTESNDWVKWIDGASFGDIDIDNDGEMPLTRALIDISQGLSQRLGRQMSMYSTYTVDYLSIQLINVDDTTQDNYQGAEFGGKVAWYTPTKHRIDALQLMRQVEKAVESTEIDGDSWLLSLEKDYLGVRFNWDADHQIDSPTGESFALLAGTQWDMAELFEIYSDMEGLPVQHNALWTHRTGYTDNISWNAYYRNNAIDTDGLNATVYQPQSNIFQMTNMNAEVLGGLMCINVTNSSTDVPELIGLLQDDDYRLLITVGISGWSDF